MVILVTGGSGSGKSQYAEELITAAGNGLRYYVATMEAFGEEGQKKVERHRELRQGKGFHTLERPRDLGGLCLPGEGKKSVLIECISNLAANELFGPEGLRTENLESLSEQIVCQVQTLLSQAELGVIVTGQVDGDGILYSRETMAYIRLMGLINRRLAAISDQVWEVACGIPIQLKACKGGEE